MQGSAFGGRKPPERFVLHVCWEGKTGSSVVDAAASLKPGGFSFDEFFLSNSFHNLRACFTSFFLFCLYLLQLPLLLLSCSLFLIPILAVSRGTSSELSFVLFSLLNGRSHFTELPLWPSTQWKWHEKGLQCFVLWTSVIGRFCMERHPSDQSGFHDPRSGRPLFTPCDRHFAVLG